MQSHDAISSVRTLFGGAAVLVTVIAFTQCQGVFGAPPKRPPPGKRLKPLPPAAIVEDNEVFVAPEHAPFFQTDPAKLDETKEEPAALQVEVAAPHNASGMNRQPSNPEPAWNSGPIRTYPISENCAGDDPCPWLPATGVLENLSFFLGLDGSKGPEDLGINANFGSRAGVNWGYPLLESYGLGVQLGTGFNYARNAVGVLQTIDGTRERTQSFNTVGLFQRTDLGLNWGVVYDFLFEDYYADINLSQWRGQVSYAFTDSDEVGLWGTLNDRGQNASIGDVSFRLKAIEQGNVFWRHTWCTGAITRIWIGMEEEHGKFVFVLPSRPIVHDQFEFGADVFVPLNNYLALFGEANFITPPASGTVAATFGFALYPSGGARSAGASRFAPLLPVANNPTFAVDLQR